jgi:sugar phosphate isomerase/epimerase
MIKHVNHRGLVAKFLYCLLLVSLALCAGLPGRTQAAAAAVSPRPLYVYNFGGLETLTPEQQCNLVTETGYAGLVLKIETPADLDNLPLFLASSIKPNGPKILAVFVRFGFTNPAEDLARSRKVVELIAGQDIALWLILDNKKKPAVTAAEAEDALTGAVSFASSRGVRSALYPHSRCLVSSAEEALPFVEKIHRPDFGLVLNLCHELRAHNGDRLREVIQKVAPSVSAIVISGADAEVDFSSPKSMDQSTVQPLDHSAFDWAGFLAAADAAGIRAPVAFINFKITPSPREYLARSLAAWRQAFSRSSSPSPSKSQTRDAEVLKTN